MKTFAKKILLKSAQAILLFLLCANANAGFLLSLGLTGLEYDDDLNSETELSLSTRLGYSINDYFDLNAEFNLGIGSSDEEDDFSIDEIDTFSVFVQTNIPLENEYRIYLLAGWTNVRLKDFDIAEDAPAAAFIFRSPDETRSQSGVSYGIGLQIPLEEENVYVQVEYISYLDEDEFDGIPVEVAVDAVSLRIQVYY